VDFGGNGPVTERKARAEIMPISEQFFEVVSVFMEASRNFLRDKAA
jgi:hypothetical protein